MYIKTYTTSSFFGSVILFKTIMRNIVINMIWFDYRIKQDSRHHLHSDHSLQTTKQQMCVALLMCLFVLCVACLTVFVNCLVKQFAMCLVCVVVLCWIDHVWSSKECVC